MESWPSLHAGAERVDPRPEFSGFDGCRWCGQRVSSSGARGAPRLGRFSAVLRMRRGQAARRVQDCSSNWAPMPSSWSTWSRTGASWCSRRGCAPPGRRASNPLRPACAWRPARRQQLSRCIAPLKWLHYLKIIAVATPKRRANMTWAPKRTAGLSPMERFCDNRRDNDLCSLIWNHIRCRQSERRSTPTSW